MPRGFASTVSVLAMVIAAMAISLLVILFTLKLEVDRQRTEFREDIVYFSSQLERENLVLIAAIEDYRRKPSPGSLDRLRTRFDIVWSRITDASSEGALGRLYRSLPGGEAVVRQANLSLSEGELLIETVEARPDALDKLRALFEPASLPFHDLVVQAVAHASRSVVDRRARFSDLYTKAMLLLIGALLCSAILAGFVVQKQRSLSALRASLAERVEERTAELAESNRQLTREVEERKRAEEEMSRSEQRFRSLYNDTPVMLQSSDADGRLLSVSDYWLRVLGYRRDEVIGRPASDFLTEESRQYAETIVRPLLLRKGAIHDIEYQLERRDGTILDVLLSAVAGRDEEGNLRRSMAVLIDISARRTAERALAESESKLRQAQKMEAIGQLTGGIAHDFNNLLAVIIGNLELIGDSLAPNSETRSNLKAALAAADRGAETTQRLLAFARRQALVPTVTDLDKLVRGMTDLLRRTLGETIEIRTVSKEGALWKAMVDQGQLEGALLNLAINSQQAMPDGGTLTFETRNVVLDEDYARRNEDVTPGNYVMLRVTDSGVGVPGDIIGKVFEPFFTTKDVGKGTGLGLSMVYGFVKQSRGHARIESVVGQGTTVELYLPRAERPVKAAPAPRPASEQELSGQGQTIVVVEDDPDVRELASTLLVNMGYRVHTAVDGHEGLELLRGRKDVDLLLTDVVLPRGMSGVELAKRADALHPGIHVLYMSGYTENAALDCRARPAHRHLLTKPFRRRELALRVHQMIGEKPHLPNEDARSKSAQS